MNAEAPRKPEPGDEPLVVWSIYDHPADFPNNYVARQWLSFRDGTTVPGEGYMICPRLEPIRTMLQRYGLICFPRDPSDDPLIIESWL